MIVIDNQNQQKLYHSNCDYIMNTSNKDCLLTVINILHKIKTTN